MAITIDVFRTAANTSTGNQTFTGSLGGLTPKAAKFEITRATTDGTAANHANYSIGAADGTTEWYFTITSENGIASTDEAKRSKSDHCIGILSPGSTTVDGEASFVSFGANSVTVNWTNAPSSAYLVKVTLYAGSDLSVDVGTYSPGTTVDGDVDVNTVGFEPDVLELVSILGSHPINSGARSELSYGIAVNDGSDTQRCINITEQDAQANGVPVSHFSTLYGAMEISQTTGAINWGSEINTFDSSGFTSTLRIGGASTDVVGYIALAFNNAVSFWLGTHDTPTSTGNQSSTAPGFQPDYLTFGQSFIPTINSATTGANAGTFGVASIVSGTQIDHSIAIEDAAATTDTQSLSDNQAINFPQDDGTSGHVATFVSFDTSGWTLNFSTTNGTARKYFAFAIGQIVTVKAKNQIISY